jgi:hypothetical protein
MNERAKPIVTDAGMKHRHVALMRAHEGIAR